VYCGHLCAQHRSTDQGGSRELEPTVDFLNSLVNIILNFAKSPPLAVPETFYGLERLKVSTAALRFARCITHWVRSQPHPLSYSPARAHNP